MEQLGRLRGGDPRSKVSEPNDDSAVLRAAGRELHQLARRGVADRVVDQVPKYTLQEMEEREIDHVGGTAILERRNGRWMIRHLHTGSRPRQRDR